MFDFEKELGRLSDALVRLEVEDDMNVDGIHELQHLILDLVRESFGTV